MADIELVNKWTSKADQDFGFAFSSLEEESEYFPQICWHFQQSAEKYLKAYILAFDLEFRKIHDLIALLKICSNKDANFISLTEECKYLQKFYIEARYPVIWETKWTKEDALKAMNSAKNILAFIKDKISA